MMTPVLGATPVVLFTMRVALSSCHLSFKQRPRASRQESDAAMMDH